MKFKFSIIFLFFTNIFSNSNGAPKPKRQDDLHKGKEVVENEELQQSTTSITAENIPILGTESVPYPENDTNEIVETELQQSTTSITAENVPILGTEANETVETSPTSGLYVITGYNTNEGELQEIGNIDIGGVFAMERMNEKTPTIMNIGHNINANTKGIQKTGGIRIGMGRRTPSPQQTGSSSSTARQVLPESTITPNITSDTNERFTESSYSTNADRQLSESEPEKEHKHHTIMK